jgi:hypothetical protein
MTSKSVNVKISVEYQKLLEKNKADQNAARSKNENKFSLKKKADKTSAEIQSSNLNNPASSSTSAPILTPASGGPSSGRSNTGSYRDEPPAYGNREKSQRIGIAWAAKTKYSSWQPGVGSEDGYAGTNYQGYGVYGTVYWRQVTGNYSVHYGCGDGSQWISRDVNYGINVPNLPPATFDGYTLAHTEYYADAYGVVFLRKEIYTGSFSFRELDWYGDTDGFNIPSGAGSCILCSIDFINLSYIDTTVKTWYAVDYAYETDQYTYHPNNNPASGDAKPAVYGFAMDPNEWSFASYGSPPVGQGWLLSLTRTILDVSKDVQYYLVTNTSIREIFPPAGSLIRSYVEGYMVMDNGFTGYNYGHPNYLDFPLDFQPYYSSYWYGLFSDFSSAGITVYGVTDICSPEAFVLLYEEAPYWGYPNFCEQSDLISYSGYGVDLPFKYQTVDKYDGLVKAAFDAYGAFYAWPELVYPINEDLLIREAKQKNDPLDGYVYPDKESLYEASVPSTKNTVKRKDVIRLPWPPNCTEDDAERRSLIYVDYGNPGYCKKMCLLLGFTQENITP